MARRADWEQAEKDGFYMEAIATLDESTILLLDLAYVIKLEAAGTDGTQN